MFASSKDSLDSIEWKCLGASDEDVVDGDVDCVDVRIVSSH